jgi:hypothetical protein
MVKQIIVVEVIVYTLSEKRVFLKADCLLSVIGQAYRRLVDGSTNPIKGVRLRN